MATAEHEFMTIGEVVEKLKAEHPDLTISKVRFLEDEGLVSPERTSGGYRKFHAQDLTRIELVLRLQKDHYMPLAVIREKLKDLDKGRMPADIEPVVARGEAMSLPFEAAETIPVASAPDALGLPVAFVRDLAEFGLVALIQGEHGEELSAPDVAIAHACWDLRKFGIEPRHLRMYATFADREATFFSQALMPSFRHRTPETRQKLLDALNELTELTNALKRSMLHRALTRAFDDVM
ncbi:MAG: MerR family transcriptional regulator [Coriobacteriia bacterium]